MQKRYIVDPQVIGGWFNQMVTTPLGKGRAFGQFLLKNAAQEGIEQRVVVRLPVNDVTRPRLMDENCLTKRAEKTAVFTFAVHEVEA